MAAINEGTVITTYKLKIVGFTNETPFTDFTPSQFRALRYDEVNDVYIERGGRQYTGQTLIVNIVNPV